MQTLAFTSSFRIAAIGAMLLGSVGATAAPAAALASPAPASPARPASGTVVETGRVECWVDSGANSYQGHANVRVLRDGPDVVLSVDRYRMGLQGGTPKYKANINARISSATTPGWTTSPDNMSQDLIAHEISPAMLSRARVSSSGTYSARVEFVFDTPGNDPKCTAGTILSGSLPE
jgi:hypothetical protein